MSTSPWQPSVRRRRPLLSVKDLLWFTHLFPLRFLSSRLSPANLYRLGRVFEPLVQVATAHRKSAAMERMALAVDSGLSRDAIPAITNRFVSNAIWRAMDDLTISNPGASLHMTPPDVHGLNHLENALSAGKGAILTTGHFYANRLAKRHLGKIGYPVLSVRNGKPSDEWMGRIGARLLHRRYFEFLQGVIGDEVYIQDPECTLKIFRRLRAGGIVNVHLDSNFSPHYLEVPFLGRKGRFAAGLLEIVRLSGCAVVPMLCLGNREASSIHFGEPFALRKSGSREEFIQSNLPTLVSILEEQILENPDQWELWVRL